MNNNLELSNKLKEIGARIRDLREIEGSSIYSMAERTGLTVAEYTACEDGNGDINFAFIYRCAQIFNVDVTDIIEGASPTLASYTLTRSNEGQFIDSAHKMTYYSLASAFKNRIAEPLFVRAQYNSEDAEKPIVVTTHKGQEFDIVISGQLKVKVGNHIEILNAGDSIYYNSSTPHGMVAYGNADCTFYAIVLNPTGTPIPEINHAKTYAAVPEKEDTTKRIYKKYINRQKDENGLLTGISFNGENDFNFAFDILDELGKTKPNKLAMLHISKDKTERRFTFRDMMINSAKAANYFISLGIKRGDRVMIVAKRNYQFWFAMLALNKIGAVAIPATNLLMQHDYEYRFKSAGITAIICSADDDICMRADTAIQNYPQVKTKIAINGKHNGWRDFDTEYQSFGESYPRPADCPKGDDLMLMYFTSGTSGYPKIAMHNYKYPLGHFITAKYWQCVNPDGLHLTIADTGWAKAMWGKLYGQWLCEAAIFVYDFDKFDAADILPMFAKYKITTFCAPPTMYRMMMKQDLTKYDLSSVEHANIAGEALNPEVFRQIEKSTGLKIMEGFGQSETTVVIANLKGAPHKLGSMGKPVPLYDVDLVDPDGNPVGVGESGEIVIRTDKGAPCGLFAGYYNDESKTNEVWHDGMYHTGDVAWRDEDGFYWYIGRADDVIKSSGYRIGPFEIESVLMELPYVVECAVTGAPDETRGQVVKASIVLTKGTIPSEELKKEIQQYVKTHTAPYKYPRIVVFKDELPKTTSGKIKRNEL